jgi:hypothetical protein
VIAKRTAITRLARKRERIWFTNTEPREAENAYTSMKQRHYNTNK